LVHFCLRFHYLGLSRWHQVRHVSRTAPLALRIGFCKRGGVASLFAEDAFHRAKSRRCRMEPRKSRRASRVNRESDVTDATTPRRCALSIAIKREKGRAGEGLSVDRSCQKRGLTPFCLSSESFVMKDLDCPLYRLFEMRTPFFGDAGQVSLDQTPAGRKIRIIRR
jgi:hypothetical protein